MAGGKGPRLRLRLAALLLGEPIKAVGALKDSFHFGWASKWRGVGLRPRYTELIHDRMLQQRIASGIYPLDRSRSYPNVIVDGMLEAPKGTKLVAFYHQVDYVDFAGWKMKIGLPTPKLNVAPIVGNRKLVQPSIPLPDPLRMGVEGFASSYTSLVVVPEDWILMGQAYVESLETRRGGTYYLVNIYVPSEYAP